MLHIKLRTFSFPSRASSPPPVTARARQSGESVWRRGLFSCTLTAAAVEGYRRACPRFTKAPRYRRRRSPIVTHCPSSRSRVTHYVTNGAFSLSWERVRTDISVSPAVLPRSLNRLWVAISLSPVFVCFLKSILSSVCIVCCAIVNRRWPQQRLLCHRQRHHRRQHHAALALQRDMFTMDGWRRRAQRMSRRKQSNPKPLKREFVLSFSRLFPASDAWCPVTRASSVRVSVCVCVRVSHEGGHRVRFDPAPFFPAPR